MYNILSRLKNQISWSQFSLFPFEYKRRLCPTKYQHDTTRTQHYFLTYNIVWRKYGNRSNMEFENLVERSVLGSPELKKCFSCNMSVSMSLESAGQKSYWSISPNLQQTHQLIVTGAWERVFKSIPFWPRHS